MADLIYNQAKFNDQIRRIDNNIHELEGELEEFNKNFDMIRKNWAGTEYNKAEEKLMHIKKTLETALADQRKQRNYLEQKNQDFASEVSGF